ncbi:hypothetical protein ORI20_31435 [Mycobacterium sp. CVI_P3]|uniref:Uncharacterized protein n=1 Tax=Mycobacterium pinniadriaticum TaxID=2994102 RepID=A0ABT3SNV8_9MYCO|nr:hypothetical protein [Mycobacterium pinniadriaticum]MCX2934781.1 hypothetical protein [Mycobacterium pinniadriaticum]MCX2941220.1 hypothetical protein [Mycobacterium pinniadriaticum]
MIDRPLFAAGLTAGFIGVSAVMLPLNVKWKRRVFWSGWCGAAILFALYVSHRGATASTLTVAACVLTAALYAFYFTPFIKIGGRVWTFWISDAREDPDVPPPPPDSYVDRVTAPSMWWTVAALSVMTGGFAWAIGWFAPVGIMGGALVAALLAVVGHLDRKDHFPIARGRYVPFAVMVLSLIPVLLWPVVVYFAAYYLTTPAPTGDDSTPDPYIDRDS